MENSQLPLRDLHLPDPIGWWPLAPGWWFVLSIAATAAGYLAWRAYKRWQHNASRRFALRELARYEAEYAEHRNPVTLARQLSGLLRRGMLAYAPREEVAGLTGEAWLQWLDRGMPLPYFHTEGGKSLLQLPYRNPAGDLPNVDVDALLSAVRMRLSVPLRGAA
ncbi:MAG: DUF4381 domain-containing protein [Gammaproteobacteria bacterium]|nr:DUF4381 domain-containing protein [Gammaproteobacteria bacterium]MBT8111795.1 DUF4381 domain-containing protein [Gammaproteobacteria bacterium]NND47193.1 DUF4381 domain-containing protein [Woeseiaceae bacterium]NNL46494.1 DUF4381 domain-containing protein [Woeseiaceae bacterium]